MDKKELVKKGKTINKSTPLKGEKAIKEIIQSQSAGASMLQNEMIKKKLARGEKVRILTPDERIVLKEFREHPDVEVIVTNGIMFGGVTHS
jgi:hypothetical protein